MLPQLRCHAALNERKTVNDELGRTWKEVVTVYFKVLAQPRQSLAKNQILVLPNIKQK
jgi:hypothetical protein